MDILITLPELRSISLSGVSEVIGLTDFQTDELSISISGTGDINLSGQTNSLDLSISGLANISMYGTTTKNCTIDIFGEGDVEITVTDQLDVNISGIGDVFYKGNPSITSSISGIGNVVDGN